MTDHLRPATARLLQADETARIAAVRAPRWISHPVANKAHVAMGMLLDQPASLRPRGLLLTGHYHSGKTMIAERFAVEHLRQAERQRVWVIQTREGAGLSHFYTSILSMSAISAHGTVLRDCVAEGLRLIFTPVGVEDDEETRDDAGTCRAGREGHPARDAQTTFV